MTEVKETGYTIITGILIAFLFIPAENAEAQWGVGVSYELRENEPFNGFGLRIQRDVTGALPFINLGLRAHFSYFSEDVESYNNVGVPAELESYDFGLAVLAGVNVGLLNPYIGGGLGRESFEAVHSGTVQQVVEDNSLYWNLFLGAELLPLPVLKPFIEYRFTRLFNDQRFDYNQNGRLAIGITLVF